MKNRIDQSRLEKILEVYFPNCRYLLEAELDFPKGNGRFRILSSCYMKNTGHFNAAEAIMCYNQLAYALLAEAGEQSLLEGLGKIPFEQFLEWQLGNCFIVGMDNIKFKKQINPSEEFYGEIALNKAKKLGRLYIFKTSYDFEGGKATGDIELALVVGDKKWQ